jgi:hypothetical protein
MREKIKEKIKKYIRKIEKAGLVITSLLCCTSTCFAGVQDSKIATGTQNLITDLTNWLLILAPTLTILLVGYYLLRKSSSDDMDGKRWDNRIKIAIICCVGVVVASGLINLTGLITSIIGGADNVINSAFNGLIDMCFNSENYLTTNFGSSVISFSNLKALILSLSISLIVLKFLKKGFDMYVMWTDGESDTPPLTYIVYFIRAIVVAVSFSVLYDWVIQVATSFGNSILNAMNFTDNVSLTTAIANISTTGLFTAIVALIAMILLFVLYIQFLMRSLEMFVLKLGFPLACVGLVNPDGGVFKSYSEKLFKSVLTVLVQIILCKIAIILILNVKMLFGIAAIIMAIKTPKFIQEFMLGGGTGGISNVIVTTSKTMELSSQIKRKFSQLKKG